MVPCVPTQPHRISQRPAHGRSRTPTSAPNPRGKWNKMLQNGTLPRVREPGPRSAERPLVPSGEAKSSEGEPRLATRPAYNRARTPERRATFSPAAKPRDPRASPDLLQDRTHQRARGKTKPNDAKSVHPQSHATPTQPRPRGQPPRPNPRNPRQTRATPGKPAHNRLSCAQTGPSRSSERPLIRRTKSMSSEGEPRPAARCAYQRARTEMALNGPTPKVTPPLRNPAPEANHRAQTRATAAKPTRNCPSCAQNRPFLERRATFSPSAEGKRPQHIRASPYSLHDRPHDQTHQLARGV